MPALLQLDVSELEPPEPLTRVLDSVRQLAPATALDVRHRRDPLPLYPMLDELRLGHRTHHYPDGQVRLLIWPLLDAELDRFCKELPLDED